MSCSCHAHAHALYVIYCHYVVGTFINVRKLSYLQSLCPIANIMARVIFAAYLYILHCAGKQHCSFLTLPVASYLCIIIWSIWKWLFAYSRRTVQHRRRETRRRQFRVAGDIPVRKLGYGQSRQLQQGDRGRGLSPVGLLGSPEFQRC